MIQGSAQNGRKWQNGELLSQWLIRKRKKKELENDLNRRTNSQEETNEMRKKRKERERKTHKEN